MGALSIAAKAIKFQLDDAARLLREAGNASEAGLLEDLGSGIEGLASTIDPDTGVVIAEDANQQFKNQVNAAVSVLIVGVAGVGAAAAIVVLAPASGAAFLAGAAGITVAAVGSWLGDQIVGQFLGYLETEYHFRLVPAAFDYSNHGSSGMLIVGSRPFGDTIIGSPGPDIIDGLAGSDTVDYSGNSAAITVRGNKEASIVSEGARGDDHLTSIERIVGTDYDDHFIVGDISFDAGKGNDIVEFNGRSGNLEGGAGNGDTITFREGVSLNLNGHYDFVPKEAPVFSDINRTIKGFEIIIGSSFEDKISVAGGLEATGRPYAYAVYGNASNDDISGSKYKDYLDGGSHNDKINGGGGDDDIFGQQGFDHLYGEQGNDSLWAGDDEEVDILEGGAGRDTYYVNNGDKIIDDEKGEGSVNFLGNVLLGGALKKKTVIENPGEENSSSTEDKFYKDSKGNIYRFSNDDVTQKGTLSIESSNGKTLTIEDWKNGQLGIKLSGGDDRPPPPSFADPLVLDLDGNGVTTVALSNSSAFFDVDKDGLNEHTAWINANDGILVLDLNGNGRIDDASEIFSYSQTVSVTPQNVGSVPQAPGIGVDWKSGFEQLASLDTNNNGKIDVLDSSFASIKIWRDLNQDGESEADEFFSLTESGIASIDVDGQRSVSQVEGGWITDVGKFTKTDGTQGIVADVWFDFDQNHTQYEKPELSDAVASLPELYREGRVKDLQDVAQTDSELKSKLEALDGLTVENASQLYGLARDIVLRWHGANADQFTKRWVFADGQVIAAYESITDTPFSQWRSTQRSNPSAIAADVMQAEVDFHIKNSMAKLFAQTDLGATLFPELKFVGGDFLSLKSGTSSSTVLARLALHAPTNAFEKIAYWHAMISILDTVRNSFSDVKSNPNGVATYVSAVEAVLAAQGIGLNYASILFAYTPGDGDDKLMTISTIPDLIDDVLAGLPEQPLNNVALGGLGNDEIRLGMNSNIVYWGKGEGSDTVSFMGRFGGASGNPETEIRLLNLNRAEVEFTTTTDSWSKEIVVRIIATGETLTLKNAALNDSVLAVGFQFSNGETLSLFELTGGIVFGETTTDDDVIVKRAGVIDGGSGDDVLKGGRGDNTYVFDIGYGRDTIIENKSSVNDKVQFGQGLTIDSFDISVEADTLKLSIRGTEDVLIIEKQYADGTPPIENFIFANGTTFTSQQILDIYFQRQSEAAVIEGTANADTIAAGAGDQQILARDGDDTLSGGAGNDRVEGMEGNDTYIYNPGDGNDFILEHKNSAQNNQDVLVFGQGISVADVTFSFAKGSGVFDVEIGLDYASITGSWLVRVDLNNTISTIEIAELSDANSEGVELFRFADGTELSAASIRAQINVGTEEDQVLQGSDNSETLDGAGGADVIVGRGGNDSLFGGSGDDEIYGGTGNDQLHGGTGSNILDGYLGSDNYFISATAGTDEIVELDTIQSNAQTDTVNFEAGLAVSDLSVRFIAKPTGTSGDYPFAIEVSFESAGRKLLLGSSGYVGSLVENFVFANGDQLTSLQIEALANQGTSDDDVLVGNERFSTSLSGGAGDDLIFINGSGNSVNAGAGNDTVLAKYSEANTYNYSIGDGDDVYFDKDGQNTISFGPGIAASDVIVRFVEIDTSQVSESFPNYILDDRAFALEVTFTNQPGKIDYVGLGFDNRLGLALNFDNGSTITTTQLFGLANSSSSEDQVLIGNAGGVLSAGAGNDLIYGTSWYSGADNGSVFRSDDITGGTGNDVISGLSGPDTYRYNVGDGDDVVYDGLDQPTGIFGAPAVTANRLVLGAGFDPANLRLEVLKDVMISGVNGGQSTEYALKLTFGPTSGSITLIAADFNPTRAIGAVEFVDSAVVVTMAQLLNQLNQPTQADQVMFANTNGTSVSAGDGADVIFGYASNLTLSGDSGNDEITALETGNTLLGGEGNDVLWGRGGNSTLDGGEGDDIIGADNSQNIIRGGSGNDVISAFSGGNTIVGGIGDDRLELSGSSNVIEYGLGDGKDTVTSLTGSYIQFLTGIEQSDVTYVRSGSDGQSLIISVAGGGSILIESAFGNDRTAEFNGVRFANGSTLSGSAILLQLQTSTAHADFILGSENDDVLDGGSGNDVLSGGGGNDTYIFNRTYGEDTFKDTGGLDVVSLGSGITGEQLLFGRIGEDLVIEIDGRERASVTVEGQFSLGGTQRVEVIRLSDGTEVSASDIEEILLRESSTSGDDAIIGFASSDLINAGAGNDVIYGAGGSDRIDGGAGWDVVELDGTADRYTVERRGDVTAFVDKEVIGRTVLVRNVEKVIFLDAETPAQGQLDLKNNTAPVANAIQFNMREDGELRVQPADLIANVTDAEGGSIQLVEVINATGGTIRFDASGNIVFKSDANFNGTASFEYVVRDGGGLQSTGVAQIAVAPVNDRPTLALTLESVSSDEDTLASVTLPQGLFTDVDGDTLLLSARLTSGEPLPTWLSFNPTSRSFSGTPPQDFNGVLRIEVIGSDGTFSETTNFTLRVSPVNDAPVAIGTLSNQSAVAGAALNFGFATTAFADVDDPVLGYSASLANGSPLPAWLSFNAATGQFSGRSPQGFVGVLSLKVTATDGQYSAGQVFNLTIQSGNVAPVLASPLADQVSNEDQAVTVALPAGTFTDADGDALTFSATLSNGTALPAWLVVNATTGAITGTPPANFNGSFTIKLTASDGTLSATDEFVLTVAAVNDAPVLTSVIPNANSNEDAFVSLALPQNLFFDVDNAQLALSATFADGSALPAWLVFDAATGGFSGTPPSNFNGNLTVKVSASDGELQASGLFTLAITPINDAPVLSNALADVTTAEDQPVNFTLPANAFSDVDGDVLSLSAKLSSGAALPAWLTFDGATRTFSGTPPANFNGSLSVVVTASDGQLSANDTFVITITPVNDAPIIAIPVPDRSSLEDQALSFSLPNGSFTDVDGDILTYSATLANGSSFPSWLIVNSNTGALSGTPPANFNGVLDVKLTASDGTASVSDVFTLTVIAVNDAPVVSLLIPDTSSLEDQAVNFALPANTFFDVDGNALTLTATLSNGDALPSWLSFNATTGAFTGTPPLNLNGSLNVKVTASDGELSAFDTFTLAITPVNDAPVVATLLPDRSSAEDTALSFTVPAGAFSDVDNAALTYSATLANGTALPSWLTFNAASQTFSGIPPLNFNGSLDVKVVASDGALSASDVFALSITPVNDAPVIAQLLADVSSAEDTAISFILPVNAFSDVDNTSLSYIATLASGAALPSWLSFNAATRQFSGTPPLNFFGSLDVKVTASDGALAASDVFTLNITPVNDAPVAVNDGPLAVTFNTALTITAASLLANDSDVDGNALSITGVQAGVNGSVALNSLGNIVFTPTAGFSGSASFTYTLSDGNGASSTAAVALSVSSGSNIINGTAGSNILFGTAANDIINALAGDDVVVAGDGNDTIYAGSGTDLVEAGNGNDLIYGEAGTDIIYGNDGDDIAYGGDGDDFVIGANGNDTIYGDLGNDSLQGDAGNDLIYGGAGADTMYGGSGNDVLSGQAGNDIMSGDIGNDRFVFAAGFGKDRVTDFQAGSTVSDIIQLSLGTNFDTFAEVMAATTNVQGNAVIAISSSDTITLVGVTKAMLVDNDFLFT
jgi:Ca2+-binding RTX toxin-like protein